MPDGAAAWADRETVEAVRRSRDVPARQGQPDAVPHTLDCIVEPQSP